MRFSLKGVSILAISSAILIPAVAQAQEDADLDDNHTIVVTAERRGQDIQTVPVSVVSLSGEALKDRGVSDLQTLQSEVPSLTYTDQGNVKYFNVRGIGISEAEPNQTVGVAIHWDGTYVAREFVFGDAFFDVAAVEVLRGPQGTYAGQNATGGALFITSVRPDFNGTSGFAEATIGNFGRRQVGAGATFQISDSVAVRVSGEVENRDGIYLNLGPQGMNNDPAYPNQPGGVSRYVGRAQLLFQPSDDFDLLLIHQFSDRQTDGIPRKRFDDGPFGDRTIAYDVDQQLDTSYHRTTAILNYTGIDAFAVRLLGTYHETSQSFTSDDDNTTSRLRPDVAPDATRIIIDDRYYTGEINLISPDNQPFQWTVGATILDYRQPGTVEKNPFGGPALYAYFDTVRKNQSVFGEVGYELTPDLEVKIGGRYNWDQVGFSSASYFRPVGSFGPTLSLPGGIRSFGEFTGRAVINWQATPDHFLYASISKGYKPGGTTMFGIEYESENVINYEAGWKGSFMDRAITTSVSAFYMDYRAFQVSYSLDVTDPMNAITQNVDGTTIKGVEAQIALDLGGFHLDASMSYLDAKYGDLLVVQPPGLFGGGLPVDAEMINLKGRTIPFSAKFSGGIGVSYAFDLGDGALTPSLRVTHQGQQWASFYQAPYHVMPAKTLVNARLDYVSDNDWKVGVYARNLLNKEYITTVSQTVEGNGSYTLGMPREIGVTLGYSF